MEVELSRRLDVREILRRRVPLRCRNDGISNKSLRALGSETNAFRLAERIVEKDIYKYTRNPMSLGYYLNALCIGFIQTLDIIRNSKIWV
jgi:hypothetical protein